METHEIQCTFARPINFEETFVTPPLNAYWLIPEKKYSTHPLTDGNWKVSWEGGGGGRGGGLMAPEIWAGGEI